AYERLPRSPVTSPAWTPPRTCRRPPHASPRPAPARRRAPLREGPKGSVRRASPCPHRREDASDLASVHRTEIAAVEALGRIPQQEDLACLQTATVRPGLQNGAAPVLRQNDRFARRRDHPARLRTDLVAADRRHALQ